MQISQIAVQLWTVRNFCQTAADLVRTAARIRAIGYVAVELGGLGPIPEDTVVKILRETDLGICASHEPVEVVLNHTQTAIARIHRLGSRMGVCSFPAKVDFSSADQVRAFALRLGEAGACFREAGLTLGYHHHAIEFAPCEGRPALERIFLETDPRHVAAELDTYWVKRGGYDPADWCRKMRGRLPLLHLKDFVPAGGGGEGFREIGRGELKWAEILAAADAAGCRWFIVEQDECPGDPFESLRVSYDCLSGFARC